MKSGSVILLLGGARSGKSAYAEKLAGRHPAPVYVATGQAFDDEMRLRINQHRLRRGGHWSLIEEPLELPDVINGHQNGDQPLLVDCLTLWLSNVMLAERDVVSACTDLLDAIAGARSPLLLVANEVGLGIVPEHRLGREFRDHAGRLNQSVAAVADDVYLLVAGIPLTVKGG